MSGKFRVTSRVPFLTLLVFGLPGSAVIAAAAPAPTTTVLTLSETSVPVKTTVTLTATVSSGGKAVSPGLVLFCNAAVSHCTDINVLAQGQLTGAGVAAVRLRLGVGSHKIKAEFHGTNSMAASTSSVQTLRVTGQLTTTSFIYSENRTLHGFVSSDGSIPATGRVDFRDASNSNLLVASVPLYSRFLRTFWNKPAYTFGVGASPGPPALGDFNNDGIPDIVQLDPVAGATTVLLGSAHGKFTAKRVQYPGGSAAAVGDFNSDGNQDIAVIQSSNELLTVLLGKGDGTFTVGPTTTVNSNASGVGWMITADFNNDGIPDLLTTNNSAHGLAVLLGIGDGTFDVSSPIPSINYCCGGVVAGDFNGDGISDIAATDYSALWILLSKGDGTFTLASSYAYPDAVSVAVADLNRDGILDLAGSSDGIYILTGNGDGTFTPAPTPPFASYGPDFVAAGDFNGDSVPDLVTANTPGSIVSILIGKGNGTFENPHNISVPDAPYQAAVADFNGDGLSDVVVNEYWGDKMSVVLGRVATVGWASAYAVMLPGAGTQKIFASYQGDEEHSSSNSAAEAAH